MNLHQSPKPLRYPTPPSITDIISPTDPSSITPSRGKDLPKLPSQLSKHPLPARPPLEVCAHVNVRSNTTSRSQSLSSARISPAKSDVGDSTSREPQSISPASLLPTSRGSDSLNGNGQKQHDISPDLSSSQYAIHMDDPYGYCIDGFETGFRPLGELTAFPINPAIHSDEDFTGIGQLRLASDECYLPTMENLDTDSLFNGLSLDLQHVHPGEFDASDLVEPLSCQSNRERPAQHNCGVNMTIFSENKSRGCGEQLATSKRLSSGAEAPGERPPKRPRPDDYPTTSGTGAAEDRHDNFLKLVDVINTVPIDSPTFPAGEHHQIAASKIHRTVHLRDNTSMSDQDAGDAYSSASLKPLSVPDTPPCCDKRPATTGSPRDVDFAHQRRRSIRHNNLNGQGGSSTSITPSYADKRTAKHTKKRGRASKEIRAPNTKSHRDEHTFTALRSQFLSSSLEVRLQLVSWLFEAALPRCMHDSGSTAGTTREVGDASDEEEWEVEEIVASRVSRGKLQYQVHWKGCDPDRTWYPAHGFKGAPYKVRSFHSAFPDQPGPPKRLEEWLDSWESGRELQDVPDDDLPQ